MNYCLFIYLFFLKKQMLLHFKSKTKWWQYLVLGREGPAVMDRPSNPGLDPTLNLYDCDQRPESSESSAKATQINGKEPRYQQYPLLLDMRGQTPPALKSVSLFLFNSYLKYNVLGQINQSFFFFFNQSTCFVSKTEKNKMHLPDILNHI